MKTEKILRELDHISHAMRQECDGQLAAIDSLAAKLPSILAEKFTRTRELIEAQRAQAQTVLNEARKMVALRDEVISEIKKQKAGL